MLIVEETTGGNGWGSILMMHSQTIVMTKLEAQYGKSVVVPQGKHCRHQM